MSQLTKSLKTRIEEVTATIEAQTAELAAYKKVLRIEIANEAPTEASPSESTAKTSPVFTNGASSVNLTGVEFTGNKTAFVIGVVKAHGAAGVTPKEIREVFASRNIPQSDNLIYTTLSALAKDKKLRRVDGRYYGEGSGTVSKNGSGAPAKKTGSVATARKKMSPAAIKKIREGVKKYWSAKKATAK